MSLERARQIISLQDTDRLGLAYAVEHPGFLKDYTGIDPAEDLAAATLAAVRNMDADLVGGIPETMDASTAEKHTDDRGVTSTPWGDGATPWYVGRLGDFGAPEKVISYDPRQESLLPWRADHRAEHLSTRGQLGSDALAWTCVYYSSLVTHCESVFGWENFLTTAAGHADRFALTLERIGQHSRGEIELMAQCETPLCGIHDDIAMTRGLILGPAWLRQYALPWYEVYFDTIKRAGAKAMFVSDGNYIDLVEDLLAAGAEGFYVDHSVDVQEMMRKCAGRAFVISTFDQRVLATGDEDAVGQHALQHIDIMKRQPGGLVSLTVPHDIKLANVYSCLDAIGARA